MKPGRRWKRMAEMYLRFSGDQYDRSEQAAMSMFRHESLGEPLRDPETNAYSIGKKWMDVTVAYWNEDIKSGELCREDLDYPDWFLDKVLEKPGSLA